jgi:DNA ligase-1
VGRSNETSAQAQAVKEAIAKWKKQIKKKYFLTPEGAQASAGTTAAGTYKPMLAKTLDSVARIAFPADVQPKFNGVRCLARQDQHGNIVLQSRGGDYYSVAHISQQLAAVIGGTDLILDGELYLHGESLQTITSLVKRPQDDSARITYCVYDVTNPTCSVGTWIDRAELLKRTLTTIPVFSAQYVGCVMHSPTLRVHELQHVHDAHALFVAQGFEGAIVRTHGGLYEFGKRSPNLVKVKAFKDEEFEVVGYSFGKGKFVDVTILRCVTKAGKSFDVTPKGTTAERAALAQTIDQHMHKMYTVQFFDWTDDGIPQHPVGIGFRDASEM